SRAWCSITASRRAIRSGSRKMRGRARSPPCCSASVRPAWPRLANCFWQRRLVFASAERRGEDINVGKRTRGNTMKAAVLYEVNKPLMIEAVSLPSPGPREVLIRTAVAGLCHSDLHFIEGLYPHPLPAVLGHESAGIVEKVGSDVTYVKPGDHVVTCLSVFCGTCDNCTTGRTVLCTDTTVKMLPGASNRLQWGKTEKLNQFLNLSS